MRIGTANPTANPTANFWGRLTRLAVASAGALALSGCISLGAEPPESLITLTPAATPAPGTGASGRAEAALAVLPIDSPQRLNVTRVPVQVTDSNVAYLQDATWVEKPARLFQRLLAQTIRAGGNRLVVEGGDARFAAETRLSGQLLEMGYDARSQSVTVRFEGILSRADGEIRTRIFESRRDGITPETVSVAPALNGAANDVAAQVAEWVG